MPNEYSKAGRRGWATLWRWEGSGGVGWGGETENREGTFE